MGRQPQPQRGRRFFDILNRESEDQSPKPKGRGREGLAITARGRRDAAPGDGWSCPTAPAARHGAAPQSRDRAIKGPCGRPSGDIEDEDEHEDEED